MVFSDNSDLNKLLTDVREILAKSREAEKTGKSPGSSTTEDLFFDTESGQLGLQSSDGLIELTISEDAMTVRGDFFPPLGGGRPLTLEFVENLLIEKKITWGVHWPLIRSALADCVTDGFPVKNVFVAAGVAPIPEYPERIVIKEQFLEARRLIDQEALSIDWKTQSPLMILSKGTLVAEKVPAQEGVGGYDVYGTELSFPRHNFQSPEPGPNILEEASGFVAATNGVFRFDKVSFRVDPVLVLNKGVNYETGNIDFPGDVMIQGEIAPGFKIRCEGNFYSRSVIDSTNIECSGDLITPIGVIGKGAGVVKVGGKVIAKFLENCVLRAQQSIEIASGIMNSSVQTLDHLKTGPRSLIMGSKIQAQNGIDVYQIGSERGSPTEIHCGLDFSVLDKIVWIRDHNMTLVPKIRALEIEMKKHPEQAAEIEKVKNELREEIRKLNALSENLLNRLDRNENAVISVFGAIFPGTLIEICHVTLVLSKQQSHVQFYLDRKLGKVLSRPL